MMMVRTMVRMTMVMMIRVMIYLMSIMMPLMRMVMIVVKINNYVSGRAWTKSRGLAGCEGESKSQSRVQVFRCVYYNYYHHIDPLQLYQYLIIISLSSNFQQFNVLSSPMISHSKSA